MHSTRAAALAMACAAAPGSPLAAAALQTLRHHVWPHPGDRMTDRERPVGNAER